MILIHRNGRPYGEEDFGDSGQSAKRAQKAERELAGLRQRLTSAHDELIYARALLSALVKQLGGVARIPYEALAARDRVDGADDLSHERDQATDEIVIRVKP